MSIQSNFPSIRPTLDLNFAGSRTVDPRITFTRASTATYFDEFGVMRTAPANAPRIDFDPVTGECKGLLIEEQRTNLLTYSEQFDNASWTKDGTAPNYVTILPNAIMSPDGSLTADKLVEKPSSAGAISHSIYKHYTTPAGAVTLSIFAKAGERSIFRLGSYEGAIPSNPLSAVFDLAEGTVKRTSGLTTSASITSVGNGWYRCVASGVSGGNSTSWSFNTSVAVESTIYTGDGNSGIYIWGAQLETGNAPTSYIPTTSAQVTRAGDILSLTGLNASSWYKQDEGTFLIEFTPYTELQSTVRMLIGSNPGYIAYFLQNSASLRTYDGTSITSANNGASAGSKQKAVVTYSGSSVTLTIDGTNPVTGTFDGGYGADIYIGCLSNGTQLNGWIRRISYYPKPLQNANLLALTA